MSAIQEMSAEAAASNQRWHSDGETYALKLSFGELVLIYKALQAVKTLDALPREDELLDDSIELVDRALTAAVS